MKVVTIEYCSETNLVKKFNLVKNLIVKISRCTDQAPLSYALPNEEPASHLNADDHINGGLKRANYVVDSPGFLPPH